jgi:PAS domain S-box-containing protein
MIRVFDRRVAFSLALAVLVLLLNSVLDYRNIRELHDLSRSIVHLESAPDSLDKLLLSMVDAETGERGFLLTGDQHYLAPYFKAVSDVKGELESVKRSYPNEGLQQASYSNLEKDISARLAELQHTAELRRTNPDAARRIVLAGEGKKLMDSIRARIGAMREQEQALLRSRRERFVVNYNRAIKSGLVSSIVGFLLVAAFVYFWRRDALAKQRNASILHEQREWFRTTLSSIGDAVIATDSNGTVQFMNNVAQKLTEWSEEEAVGRPLIEVFQVIDDKKRQKIENPVSTILNSGKISVLANHVSLVTRSGKERAISDSGAPIRDLQGNTKGVVLVFRDVTDEMQASQTLRLLASIVESSDDAIYAKALDGTILSWNSGAEHIFGYSAREMIGGNVSILVPPEMRDEVPEILRRISRGERIAHYETVRVRKDGSRVYVSMSLSPLTDENGDVTGASSLARDITDRKMAEQALQNTAHELDRSNKELEQFAYIASHDLQEPLRTMAGYLQLLSDRYKGRLDEKADKYITYAIDGAERMSTIIRDLLSYSRVSTRGEAFDPASSEEALEFALRNLRSAREQSGASITHDPLPVVHADKIQLAQLFQNLIGNAIKYRSPQRPPRIHISASREDGFWKFDVEDNGIGFEQQYEDKMFRIFQRLHSRGKYPGTGIGLAICKRIVDRHGGRIWATGEPDRGAKFSFTIPIRGES